MPNLLLAAHNAGQGKRQRDEVVEFEKKSGSEPASIADGAKNPNLHNLGV